MGDLLKAKKRAKKREFKRTTERLQKAEEERKQTLEREFHNQRGESITVIEMFNIISTVLNDLDRYRIQDELKSLIVRRSG